VVPTLAAAPGARGQRPVVGTRDCKGVLHASYPLDLTSGALHGNALESLQAANRRGGESKTRRMQRAFAGHL
jgi:hypothetical protein